MNKVNKFFAKLNYELFQDEPDIKGYINHDDRIVIHIFRDGTVNIDFGDTIEEQVQLPINVIYGIQAAFQELNGKDVI